MTKYGAELEISLSPSSRRAWIEIFHGLRTRQDSWVALLAEGVDRNKRDRGPAAAADVALLAEGVDRNRSGSATTATTRVALLAEGVDRNRKSRTYCFFSSVALLAEGVDRNT